MSEVCFFSYAANFLEFDKKQNVTNAPIFTHKLNLDFPQVIKCPLNGLKL